MKSDRIKQYITLRTSLEQERDELHARLKEIEAALGVAGAAPLPVNKRSPGRPKGSKNKTNAVAVVEVKPARKTRRLSAATKAKMSKAAKERWAARKAKAAAATKSTVKPEKKGK